MSDCKHQNNKTERSGYLSVDSRLIIKKQTYNTYIYLQINYIHVLLFEHGLFYIRYTN